MVQHAKETQGTASRTFEGAAISHLLVLVVALMLSIPGNAAVGESKCGSPPIWTSNLNISKIAISGAVVCTTENDHGYPVPGFLTWNRTTFPNGTIANVSYCVAGSAVHPVFNSSTYKVLTSPSAASGDRPMAIAIANPAVGLMSIKLPECTVTADGWNVSRVDPRSGPLYIGWPAQFAGAASTNPGAYIPGAGFVNGWMASPWTSYMFVLAFRKKLAVSEHSEKDFACYEGLGATGTLMKNFTILGSRTNCVASCLMNATCTMTTITYKDAPGFGADSVVPQIDPNVSSQKAKRVSRHLVECNLYTGGFFVGSTEHNTTLCTKLVD